MSKRLESEIKESSFPSVIVSHPLNFQNFVSFAADRIQKGDVFFNISYKNTFSSLFIFLFAASKVVLTFYSQRIRRAVC